MLLLLSADFLKLNFFKDFFRNTIRVTKGLLHILHKLILKKVSRRQYKLEKKDKFEFMFPDQYLMGHCQVILEKHVNHKT